MKKALNDWPEKLSATFDNFELKFEGGEKRSYESNSKRCRRSFIK